MTTAAQPSELVFEFASNGMDEINQVSAGRRRLTGLVHGGTTGGGGGGAVIYRDGRMEAWEEEKGSRGAQERKD